jgi:hypothetical protein
LVEDEGLDPPGMASLAIDPIESLEHDTVETQLPPQEVPESLATVLPGLVAIEVLNAEEERILGGGSRVERVGVDPPMKGVELGRGDAPEVLEDTGLDVTLVPVALGETGVDAAVLGSKDVEVESAPPGRHEEAKDGGE